MGIISGIAGLFAGDTADYYNSINPPDPESMKLQLEEYVQQGLLQPEDVDTIMQNPSSFEKIVTDPAFKNAQMKALTGLQDISEQGGLTATDRARLSDIAKGEGIRERGSREAILSNAAEKGTSGSGLEFLSQLKNQQESAGRTSDRDTQVAADAEKRALDALINSGTMASNMENQEFGEKSKIAEATDAINRFNTSNLNETERANVAARNAASAANLAAKQSVADTNVGGRNYQQQYNKNLYQTDFENKMRKAGAQASASASDTARKLGSISGIESGAAGLMGGVYDAATKKKLAGVV